MAAKPVDPAIIQPDKKGIYHPKTESEIQDLVKYAYNHCYQVRVRGSGHSTAQAIYSEDPNVTKINILLDHYTGFTCEGDFATANAGIHLGHDPNDPLSTLENSLLYQLHHDHNLALEDLGGITHQTVSGFISTGSSGGSFDYGVLESVYALRIIDGKGDIYEVSRDEKGSPTSDEFQAALVSVGLLGVLSKVTFKCTPSFNIKGCQKSELVASSEVIDIYSDEPAEPIGDDPKLGLTPFFTNTPYTRIMWWPQTATVEHPTNPDIKVELHERIQVWQAKRHDSSISDDQRFKVFDSALEMMLASYLLTLMGNLKDDKIGGVMGIVKKMQPRFKQLHKRDVKSLLEKCMKEIDPKILEDLAQIITTSTSKILMVLFQLIVWMADVFSNEEKRLEMLPAFSTTVIAVTNFLDGDTNFEDTGFQGLPMDNSVDDIVFPCSFNEMWVPMKYATKSTNLLREHFNKGGYDYTGNMAWELYVSKKTDAWMSMSYSTGEDDWDGGAFRIDGIWFDHTGQDPQEFYLPVWKLFSDEGIPFRLHWGKHFPPITSDAKADDSSGKTYDWPKLLVMNQYPHLKRFLQIRKEKDPHDIFLSNYWRHWFCVGRESEMPDP